MSSMLSLFCHPPVIMMSSCCHPPTQTGTKQDLSVQYNPAAHQFQIRFFAVKCSIHNRLQDSEAQCTVYNILSSREEPLWRVGPDTIECHRLPDCCYPFLPMLHSAYSAVRCSSVQCSTVHKRKVNCRAVQCSVSFCW